MAASTLPEDPVEFFAKAGVTREEILQDALDIRAKVNRPRGGSAHILTGPIYIDEAEPGDMLEVRIIALEHRVPYGVNNSGPRHRRAAGSAQRRRRAR